MRRPEISSVICSSDVLAVPCVCVCVRTYVNTYAHPPFYVPQTNCGYNLGNVAKSVMTRGWEKKGLGFPQALKEAPGWVMDGGVLLLLLLSEFTQT